MERAVEGAADDQVGPEGGEQFLAGGGEHDAGPGARIACPSADRAAQPAGGDGIERGGELIDQQPGRAGPLGPADRIGQREAVALALGELGGCAGEQGRIGEARPGEQQETGVDGAGEQVQDGAARAIERPAGRDHGESSGAQQRAECVQERGLARAAGPADHAEPRGAETGQEVRGHAVPGRAGVTGAGRVQQGDAEAGARLEQVGARPS